MRILYATYNPYLRSTTAPLNAIFEELRPRGLDPVMLFTKPGPWQQELQASGVPCYFDRLQMPSKYFPVRAIRDTWRLVRLIRRERVELIHCQEHDHYPALRLVARWTGLPIVVTFHQNIDPAPGGWPYCPPYSPACFQFLIRAQMMRWQKSPVGLPHERLKLILSGLSIDKFLARGDDGQALRREWGACRNTVVLGTASAIHAHKRLEDFVRLIGNLRARGLGVLGVIAGGGPKGGFMDPAYHERINRLIAETHLQSHCLMVGLINPITPFFKAIDISVSTSEMEVLSMSLCEGMACGKATIAYDVGGNPETVPDRSCLAPFGDLDAMTEKAAALVTDRNLRSRKGIEAARFVREHFDAPVLAGRQAAIYEGILRRPLVASNARTATLTEWN